MDGGAAVFALAGAAVLTGSLSYIVSVVGAAIRRRSYAQSVFGLGREPAEVIRACASAIPGSPCTTTSPPWPRH